MIITKAEAQRIRATIVGLAATLPDKEASENAVLFPRMKYNGELIPYKTRIYWDGGIKMAAVDLWDREENNPNNAPSLWTDIDYKDGYRRIKENMSAGEAFALGEKGWWNNELYESLIAANVYTPASYPVGWKKVEE